MTKEEAIAELTVHFEHWKRLKHEHIVPTDECENTINALRMAIEALKDRPTPCEKCIHVKSCRKVIILKNRTYKLIKYCSQGAERRKP